MFMIRRLSALGLGVLCCSGAAAVPTAADLVDLPFEQLLDMTIVANTATRSEKALADTPAALSVITREAMLSAGVTTLPEALQLAPGMHVVRTNNREWAVSARGMGGRLSSPLLVLVDGLSVYDATVGGVFWEDLDIPIGDIERIEVIRGPTGSLWGMNAVNGVVNIITSRPVGTPAAQVAVVAGSDERQLAARHGAMLNEEIGYRVSWHQRDMDPLDPAPGSAYRDHAWHSERLAGSVLWSTGADRVIVDASYFTAEGRSWTPRVDGGLPGLGGPVELAATHSNHAGTNLAAEWQRTYSATSKLTSRLGWRDVDRNLMGADMHARDAQFDTSFNWAPAPAHRAHVGINAQHAYAKLDGSGGAGPSVGFRLPGDTLKLYSFYAQDIWELTDRLELTAGLRIDSSEAAPSALQPSIRAMWRPSDSQRVWGAVARSNAASARIDTLAEGDGILAIVPPGPGMPLPIYARVEDDANHRMMTVDAVELGYRHALGDRVTVDAVFYRHTYDHLLSIAIGNPVLRTGGGLPPRLEVPARFSTDGTGEVDGVELDLFWRLAQKWQLRYSGSHIFRSTLGGSADFRANMTATYAVPDDMHWLRLFFQPAVRWQTSVHLGWTGEQPNAGLDDYWTANIQVDWQVAPHLGATLIGKTLLEGRVEAPAQVGSSTAFEVPEQILLKLTWTLL